MSEITKGLEHDDVRPYLIRDLAVSDKTQKVLASDYDCSPAAVSMFRSRHAEEIENYRDTLPPSKDALAELWIVDKAERIKMMQETIKWLDDETDLDSAKIKLAYLKQVEESTGQAAPKVTVTKTVNYTVRGIDMEDLS
jgi:hypothetical protein